MMHKIIVSLLFSAASEQLAAGELSFFKKDFRDVFRYRWRDLQKEQNKFKISYMTFLNTILF